MKFLIDLRRSGRLGLATMVTHMVMFRFKNMDDAEIAREKLLSMKGRVPSLVDIEAGIDFTRSDRSFELGLITHHRSRADLDAYRLDPLHLEVGGFIREKSTGAAAVDFESDQGPRL